MHHYRRFIQDNLDSRGWKQADLVRASGLSRQLIHSILRDDRDHLGQMPDESTLEGLAKGFKVPLETVRTAAARSLAGYSDEGGALTPQLQDVDIDILLNEIRRRFHDLSVAQAATPGTPSKAGKPKEAWLRSDELKERPGEVINSIERSEESAVDRGHDGKDGHGLRRGEV